MSDARAGEPPERGDDGILSHPDVERLTRALATHHVTRAPLEAPWRRAAVMLILRAGAHGELELLLIERAAYAGDPWSGHVALPGGRQEPADRSLEETALRETREETAVDIARDGRVLGALDEVQPQTTRLPPLVIAPFVAVLLRGDAPLLLSEEVAAAFWIPLAALRDPAASREIVLQLTGGPRRVRCFQHDGHTIWGLTERILRSFLELVGGG